MKKKVIVTILLLSICFSFTSCYYSKNLPSNHTVAAKYGYPEEIIGTWESTWEYNGNSFYRIIDFLDDGNYKLISYENGVFSEERHDIWYVDGWSVNLILNGDIRFYEQYWFKNGALYGGDGSDKFAFVKIE